MDELDTSQITISRERKTLEEAKVAFESNLKKNDTPDLSGLLEREGILVDELAGKIQEKVNLIVDGDINDDRNVETRFIYDAYMVTRGAALEHPELTELTNDLTNFESFQRRFLPEANKYQLANLYKAVTYFRGRVIHPLRELRIEADISFRDRYYDGIYGYHGEWVVLPTVHREGLFEIVEKSVIEEAIRLRELKVMPELFHTTGSAALEGIGRKRQIVSGGKLTETAEMVKTGEYVGYISRNTDSSLTGRKTGLQSVYVEENGIAKGYELIRWFDEYSVTFGISLEQQQQYIRENYGEVDYFLFYRTSEGMQVGPEVPLSNIKLMIVDHQELTKAREWAGINTPGLFVTSYDAYSLYVDSELRKGSVDKKLEDLLELPSFNT